MFCYTCSFICVFAGNNEIARSPNRRQGVRCLHHDGSASAVDFSSEVQGDPFRFEMAMAMAVETAFFYGIIYVYIYTYVFIYIYICTHIIICVY